MVKRLHDYIYSSDPSLDNTFTYEYNSQNQITAITARNPSADTVTGHWQLSAYTANPLKYNPIVMSKITNVTGLDAVVLANMKQLPTTTKFTTTYFPKTNNYTSVFNFVIAAEGNIDYVTQQQTRLNGYGVPVTYNFKFDFNY